LVIAVTYIYIYHNQFKTEYTIITIIIRLTILIMIILIIVVIIYIYICKTIFLYGCWLNHLFWGHSMVLPPVRRDPDVTSEPRKRPQNMGTAASWRKNQAFYKIPKRFFLTYRFEIV
jgi:hypothetical protein